MKEYNLLIDRVQLLVSRDRKRVVQNALLILVDTMLKDVDDINELEITVKNVKEGKLVKVKVREDEPNWFRDNNTEN